jgi:hypothetical protein
MTTTCQIIVDGARKFNTLNAALTTDVAEMLSRILADQQEVFTSVAGLTRERFQTVVGVTSTTGVSGRVIDLAALTPTNPPVERVLTLVLADGREANQVDVLDVDAELKPRYVVRGQTLVEVTNDWSTASGAPVNATLTYVYGPTAISPTGDLTQLVSVPDAWIDLLVLPLAIYLAQKDPGRDPAEIARLEGKLSRKQDAFVAYLTNYGGVEVKRFDLPSPQSTPQKR